MDVNRDVSYEEYIPTDRYAIQDMYLMRMHHMGLIYQVVMRAWYAGRKVDVRAMIEFYAMADEFYFFARSNIAKHLSKNEIKELEAIFINSEPKNNPVEIKRVFSLFQKFGTESKLTELNEKKLMGSFAYARAELGIPMRKRRGADAEHS